MGKLLETRLPLAFTEVDASTFNRLVRILEINLGKFDPNSTPQFTGEQISTLSFEAGDIIWNTTIDVLQVYTGNKWIQLHDPVNPKGFEATGELGKIDIAIAGDITITI